MGEHNSDMGHDAQDAGTRMTQQLQLHVNARSRREEVKEFIQHLLGMTKEDALVSLGLLYAELQVWLILVSGMMGVAGLATSDEEFHEVLRSSGETCDLC